VHVSPGGVQVSPHSPARPWDHLTAGPRTTPFLRLFMVSPHNSHLILFYTPFLQLHPFVRNPLALHRVYSPHKLHGPPSLRYSSFSPSPNKRFVRIPSPFLVTPFFFPLSLRVINQLTTSERPKAEFRR